MIAMAAVLKNGGRPSFYQWLCGLIGVDDGDSRRRLWPGLRGRLAAAYVGHTAGIGNGTGSSICVLLVVCRHDRLDEEVGVCKGRRNMPMKEEAMITKNQLHAFSESFRKLSQSFEVDVSPRGALNDQEIQDIFNAVTEQVCKDCSRCSYCWENVFEDSCESA